jgi:hypothetical protein
MDPDPNCRGETSRNKVICVAGRAVDDVRAALLATT